MQADVVVLGGGIVGSSTAAHLAKRGVKTVLVDRREPGRETSYGNAGLIQPSGVIPTGFPTDPTMVLKAALKLLPHSNYHWTALPSLFPFLWRYRVQSCRKNLLASGRALVPLLSRAAEAHRELLGLAGATDLMHPTGYYRIFRRQSSLDSYLKNDMPVETSYGIHIEVLTPQQVVERNPAIKPAFEGAVWCKDSIAVRTPGEAVTAIAGLVPGFGGTVTRGDALSLRQEGGKWRVETADGTVSADTVVVALGPWSTEITKRFGLKLPFGTKRGYHQHFKLDTKKTVETPFVDVDNGYFVAPMPAGVRLTSGIEFAKRDAPPTPVQIRRIRPLAGELLPLGEAVEPEPWMGSRPCLPDSLPALGRLKAQPSIIAAFGHQHLGLTLGPITGRVVADLITGAEPQIDLSPYRPERFA